MDYLIELYTRVFWLFIFTAAIVVLGTVELFSTEKSKKRVQAYIFRQN
jgi:hypothetical protein